MRAEAPEVSQDALDLLRGYAWPGNVRELKNLLERALILSRDGTLTREHFPGLNGGSGSAASTEETADLEELEKGHIQRILDGFNGDTIKASKALGISRSSLYRKISKSRPPA
jgi:transcriptional regulator with PAS, ATPase and Fis domain